MTELVPIDHPNYGPGRLEKVDVEGYARFDADGSRPPRDIWVTPDEARQWARARSERTRAGELQS